MQNASYALAQDAYAALGVDTEIEREKLTARQIGVETDHQLGSPVLPNVWVPDGSNDLPTDRKGPRSLGAVLDEHCRRQNAPVGRAWLDAVKDYEKRVLAQRSA